jgi:hypothetical protein
VGVGSAADMKYSVWQAHAGRYHGDCCGRAEIGSKPLGRHGALVV